MSFGYLKFFASGICVALCVARSGYSMRMPQAGDKFLCESGYVGFVTINAPLLVNQRAGACPGCNAADLEPTWNYSGSVYHLPQGGADSVCELFAVRHSYVYEQDDIWCGFYSGGGYLCRDIGRRYTVPTSEIGAYSVRISDAGSPAEDCQQWIDELGITIDSLLSGEQVGATAKIVVVGPTSWTRPMYIPRQDTDPPVEVGVTLGPSETGLRAMTAPEKPIRLCIRDLANPTHARWFFSDGLTVLRLWDGRLYDYGTFHAPLSEDPPDPNTFFYCGAADVGLQVKVYLSDMLADDNLRTVHNVDAGPFMFTNDPPCNYDVTTSSGKWINWGKDDCSCGSMEEPNLKDIMARDMSGKRIEVWCEPIAAGQSSQFKVKYVSYGAGDGLQIAACWWQNGINAARYMYTAGGEQCRFHTFQWLNMDPDPPLWPGDEGNKGKWNWILYTMDFTTMIDVDERIRQSDLPPWAPVNKDNVWSCDNPDFDLAGETGSQGSK